ncbi:hypothetical protein pdam_00017085, partial [Pocillopora damicornis]
MAVLSPNLIRGLVSTLQALLALAMITAGVFDRVKTDSNVSRIVMPIWTGFLVSIQTAVKKTLNDLRLAFVSRNMLLILLVSAAVGVVMVATYRAMNIFCSILCSLIAYWYGWLFITVLSYETDETAIVGTIFVLAMTEIFLSILGTMASMERNPYSQLVNAPVEESTDREMTIPLPLVQVQGSNFVTSGPVQGGIQAPTGAPTYQAAPRDGSPVMVPQGYMGHLVMVPAENMQKMSHTSGTAQ